MKPITRIAMIALITLITVTLPGLLYLRGLPIGWGIVLLVGFAAAAVLGYWLGRNG